MAEAAAPKFMKQAEFARRRGVSRKAVTGWKARGLLVLSETGEVDVEATEWKLDDRPAKYRGGVTHRPVKVVPGNNEPGNKPARAVRGSKVAAQSQASVNGDETDEGEPAFDPDDPNLTISEAVRRKENMLGLLRKRELEVANNEWVRVEEVGAQVEREYATVRERLLTIPGKIAARLVGLDRATIEDRIRREVTEALHELYDPSGIAERLAASGSADDGADGAEAAAGP